jgi:hypothetical protein
MDIVPKNVYAIGTWYLNPTSTYDSPSGELFGILGTDTATAIAVKTLLISHSGNGTGYYYFKYVRE